MQPGSDPPGSGELGLGDGRAFGKDHPGHARLGAGIKITGLSRLRLGPYFIKNGAAPDAFFPEKDGDALGLLDKKNTEMHNSDKSFTQNRVFHSFPRKYCGKTIKIRLANSGKFLYNK